MRALMRPLVSRPRVRVPGSRRKEWKRRVCRTDMSSVNEMSCCTRATRSSSRAGLQLNSLSPMWQNFRCCYITVDSAMAASQNGFCSYKLSIHKKTNITQIMTKKIKFYIFNLLSKRNCKNRSFYDTFLELCKHRSVMQPLKNPPFCSSTKFSCIFSNGRKPCPRYDFAA